MFNIPNFFTGLNLISGVLAIFMAMLGRLEYVPVLILLGLICDFLDGLLARLLKQKSELGKQLDSLADVVTFGVAPGIFMMVVMIMDIERYTFNPYPEEIQFDVSRWVYDIFNGTTDYYLPLVALVIPFLSLFRLAKFNLDERQTNSFIGLPVPAHTILYLFFPLVIVNDQAYIYENWEKIEWIFDPNYIAILMVFTSVLLVSNIPLFSLKFQKLEFKTMLPQIILLLISLILILLLSYWSLPLIVFLYLIISLIVNALNKSKNEIQSGN